MAIKVGINGFGRIGRNILRAALGDPGIEFVAVNDITDAKTLAHLLKYDSILGNLTHRVTHTENSIAVDGKSFQVFKVKDPAALDWSSLGAQIVVESTG
jgi:glyceraldehyde 3-phosphate dehydrogenase